MNKIKKYSKDCVKMLNETLSERERLFLDSNAKSINEKNVKKYTLVEFIEAVKNGTFSGGYVYGFNGYIPAYSITEVSSDSSMFEEFEPISSNPFYDDSNSDYNASSDFYDEVIDMSQFAKIKYRRLGLLINASRNSILLEMGVVIAGNVISFLIENPQKKRDITYDNKELYIYGVKHICYPEQEDKKIYKLLGRIPEEYNPTYFKVNFYGSFDIITHSVSGERSFIEVEVWSDNISLPNAQFIKNETVYNEY